MKRPNPDFGRSGVTLVEVLAVIAVIVILAMLILPSLGGSRRAKLPMCVNNLKQVGLGFNIFAADNHGRFPMEIPVAKGGTMEFIYSDHTFPHFEKLKRYQLQPKSLICPFDTTRQAVTNYETLNDLSLSYFVNVDSSTNDPSHSILAGDRFLQVSRQPVAPGLLTVTTNLSLGWTPDFHGSRGVFAFADGHAEVFLDNELRLVIQNQPHATNRFSIP